MNSLQVRFPTFHKQPKYLSQLFIFLTQNKLLQNIKLQENDITEFVLSSILR